MRLLKQKYIGVLFFACLLVASCKREKSYWDDDLVAPIAHGGLSLANLFPDTVIKSNSDSTLKIAFEATLINYELDSLLKIPDTTTFVKDTLSVYLPNNPILIHPADVLFSVTANSSQAENYYNLPNGIQLKKAIIKQGAVQLKMENTVRQPILYHYQLLSATKNNHILDTTFYIPHGDSVSGSLINPGILNATLDLSGYTIDFSGINHNKVNTLIETYTVSVAANAQPDTIFYRQGFTSYFTFHGIVPQYAVGYFGNQTINVGPAVTSFNIFNSIKGGMINLNSANVTLKVVNQFGVDMTAKINNITSINSINQNTVTLNSSALATPLNISGAINNGLNNPVSPTIQTITLNNNNSNITSFIGNLPDKLGYKLTAQVNPNGNLSGDNDFGYYGTAFTAYLDADIPLYFSASNLMLADTVALNFANISQINNVNRGQLTLTATNSYPFAINLQAYLLDENKMSIDLLFSLPNTIAAPQLDANLKVIAPVKTQLYIPLTSDKIASLQRAKYIYYTATFNTASQPNQVKFYNYYNLDLLLTADINYSIGK